MKARLPKVYTLLIGMALIVVLSGCELARPEGQAADAGPVSDLPPTLAPLGAETNAVGEATAIPTIINVQATAAPVIQSQDQAVESPAEPVAPTSEPAVELPVQAAAPQENAQESEADLVGPAPEETTTEEVAAQENIVVDAPEEDLPIGGPVAANPPGSPTEGGYAAPNYATGASYVVQSGDTLFRIAQQYGTTVEAIIYANGLSSDVIQAGQVLNIVSDETGGYSQPNFGQAPTQPYNNGPSQAPFMPGVGGNYHTVAPGETLFAIASQYGAPIEVIAEANGLAYPYTLGIGQQLVIPAPPSGPFPGNNFGAMPGGAPNPGNFMPGAGNHVVAPGETLYGIASQYGAPIEVIAEANGLAYPYTLNIGQQLIIPAPAPYQGNNFGPAPDNTMPQADPSTVMPGNGYVHSVAPGENLFGIAQQYGASVEAIASANGLVYPYTLGVGQPLMIPAPGAYQGPQMAPPNGYFQQPPQGYQAQPPMQGNIPQQPYQGYPAQPPVEGNLAAPVNPYTPAPGNAGTHTVAPGETLYSIATRYGTSSDMLAAANGLSNPNQLFVGQVLYLP
jgi:peptidoglycan DL-endopeptidase LytF